MIAARLGKEKEDAANIPITNGASSLNIGVFENEFFMVRF